MMIKGKEAKVKIVHVYDEPQGAGHYTAHVESDDIRKGSETVFHVQNSSYPGDLKPCEATKKELREGWKGAPVLAAMNMIDEIMFLLDAEREFFAALEFVRETKTPVVIPCILVNAYNLPEDLLCENCGECHDPSLADDDIEVDGKTYSELGYRREEIGPRDLGLTF